MNSKCIIIVLFVLLISCAPVEQQLACPVPAVQPKPVTQPSVGELSIIMLDVGQGQAILVQFPNNKIMLYDAGRNKDKLVEYLQEFEIDTIDWAIISNLDADHAAGLIGGFDVVDVVNYAKPNVPCDTKTCSLLAEKAKMEGSNVVYLSEGMTVDIDPAVKVEVLNPTEPPIWDKDNDNSIVLKITYNEFTALFSGDCEYPCEQVLLETNVDKLPSKLLIAGHHGSRTSSADCFVQAIHPEIVLVSVGANNQYGHPAPEVIAKFEAIGAEVHRTDLEGTISLTTDGKELKVETESG